MLFVLAISMFPQISLISYLFKLMSALGWINTYPALIAPYRLDLAVVAVGSDELLRPITSRSGPRRYHGRLFALADFDKNSVPVAAPGIFSTLLLAFIFAFNEFLFALMLTTDYAARTIPVGVALFEGLYGQLPWGEIMAAATITTVPVVVLTLIFQRRIIQGLTRGAVKA